MYMETLFRPVALAGTFRLAPLGSTGQSEGIARNTCNRGRDWEGGLSSGGSETALDRIDNKHLERALSECRSFPVRHRYSAAFVKEVLLRGEQQDVQLFKTAQGMNYFPMPRLLTRKTTECEPQQLSEGL